MGGYPRSLPLAALGGRGARGETICHTRGTALSVSVGNTTLSATVVEWNQVGFANESVNPKKRKEILMKTVLVHIHDDSKVQLFVDFLREIRFVQIEETASPVRTTKRMTALPQSVLHPIKVDQFRIYCREELHDITSLY